MTPKTSRYIREHLMPVPRVSKRLAIQALVDASTWADQVADNGELPWSSDLHFSHTPYRACDAFQFDRDCGFDESGRCLVSGIANYTLRAADITLPRSERADAIKFLVHFVADAHQGLHVGFAEDFGGNAISLAHPAESSLHEAWDSFLLREYKTRLPSEADSSWYGIASSLISRVETGDVKNRLRMPSSRGDNAMELAAAIVSDTATTVTCQYAYWDEPAGWIENGHSLSDDYIASRSEVMLTQFMKAGVRLAQLLDSIATAYYRAERAYTALTACRAGSGSTDPPTTRFPWEFDPEDYLYEIEDDSLPLADASAGGGSATASAPTMTTTAIPIVVRSPEEKRKIKRMKEKAREAAKKRRFMGVDLDAVVLIKRGQALFITYRHKVTDDSFVPDRASRLSVQFSATDGGVGNVVRFGFDAELILNDPAEVPKELLSAIFRKLSGLPAGSGGDVFDSAKDFKSTRHDGVPSKHAEMLAEMETLMAAHGPTPEPIHNPFRQSSTHLSLESIAHRLPPSLTPSELRMRYGGRLPSDDERINDVFFAQRNHVVIILLGSIVFVSRGDLLLDRSTRRWLVNIITMAHDIEGSDARFVYIDARLFDARPTREILESLDDISARRVNMDLLRKVAKANPPILNALRSFADSFTDTHAVLRWAAAVEELNSVHRPDRKPKDIKMVEIVLRSPAEVATKMEILAKLPRVNRGPH